MGLFGPKRANAYSENEDNFLSRVSRNKLIKVSEWKGIKLYSNKQYDFSCSNDGNVYSFRNKLGECTITLKDNELLDSVAMYKGNEVKPRCYYCLKSVVKKDANQEADQEEYLYNGYQVISEKELNDLIKQNNVNWCNIGNNVKFVDMDGAGFSFGNSSCSGGVYDLTLNGHHIVYNEKDGVVGIVIYNGQVYIAFKG